MTWPSGSFYILLVHLKPEIAVRETFSLEVVILSDKMDGTQSFGPRSREFAR